MKVVFESIAASADDIATTMLFGLGTALITLVIAYPIGYYLSQTVDKKHYRILDMLCWLPIAVPGTIIALGILGISTKMPNLSFFDNSGFFLLTAFVGMFCPFAIRILESSFRQRDKAIGDIALLNCRRWYQRVFYVDTPLHAKAIIVSLLITFVFVSGELTATVLLIPPGQATLAVTIDNLLHYGANARASVLCLFQAVLVMLILVVLSWVWENSTEAVK